MSTVEVNHLYKSYSGKIAVKDLSFSAGSFWLCQILLAAARLGSSSLRGRLGADWWCWCWFSCAIVLVGAGVEDVVVVDRDINILASSSSSYSCSWVCLCLLSRWYKNEDGSKFVDTESTDPAILTRRQELPQPGAPANNSAGCWRCRIRLLVIVWICCSSSFSNKMTEIVSIYSVYDGASSPGGACEQLCWHRGEREWENCTTAPKGISTSAREHSQQMAAGSRKDTSVVISRGISFSK